MRRLRLSDAARQFILSETEYLKGYNRAAALRFRADIDKGLRNLLRYPNIGRSDQSHPIPGVRRMVLDDYVVHYSITAATVDILFIRHVRQNEPWVDMSDEDNFEA